MHPIITSTSRKHHHRIVIKVVNKACYNVCLSVKVELKRNKMNYEGDDDDFRTPHLLQKKVISITALFTFLGSLHKKNCTVAVIISMLISQT